MLLERFCFTYCNNIGFLVVLFINFGVFCSLSFLSFFFVSVSMLAWKFGAMKSCKLFKSFASNSVPQYLLCDSIQFQMLICSVFITSYTILKRGTTRNKIRRKNRIYRNVETSYLNIIQKLKYKVFTSLNS